MSLFSIIFINKGIKYHLFKVRYLNDSFCISKKDQINLSPIVKWSLREEHKGSLSCFYL